MQCKLSNNIVYKYFKLQNTVNINKIYNFIGLHEGALPTNRPYKQYLENGKCIPSEYK